MPNGTGTHSVANLHISPGSWTLDTKETRQRQFDGIQDEMLQANTTHQMATDDNE